MSESRKAVFLSYARQDAAAAEKIAHALRVVGVEVWFDQSELRGGDAWDAAIRRQIKTCGLLIPIISSNTQSRAEGYFRLEWKLAVDRSHLMSQDRAFLVPVVIDDTSEGDERVPDRFREVQWTRLPAGETSAAFVERIQRLLRADPTAERPPTPQTPVAPTSSAISATAAGETKAPRRRWPAVAAAIVVVALGGGWFARSALFRDAPVVAYSADDRRMSFALLPLQAPADDPRAVQVARSTADALQTTIELRKELITLASRTTTEQAAAREGNPKKLARELNVHFLLRGSVAKDVAGYAVTLVSVDGDSERTLKSHVLRVPADAARPRYQDDLFQAVYELMLPALTLEVKRARARPDSALDVRDLSFRAWIDWSTHRDSDGKAANEGANALLSRALAQSPEDAYALRTSMIINLCDCVNSWSPDPEVQRALGAAALDHYLRVEPSSIVGLNEKAALYQLRGRWEDSMLIADTVLKLDPDAANALAVKAIALLHLGRTAEAQPIADRLQQRYPTEWNAAALSADVYFALGDYARAAQLAQQALVSMSDSDKRDRLSGPLQLTQIAAEARLGHADRARNALKDFNTLLPNLTTAAAIRQWVHPTFDLAEFAPLYEGLRLAGIPN